MSEAKKNAMRMIEDTVRKMIISLVFLSVNLCRVYRLTITINDIPAIKAAHALRENVTTNPPNCTKSITIHNQYFFVFVFDNNPQPKVIVTHSNTPNIFAA